MSNYKSPKERKRNHINVNFTDADLAKIRKVQEANPDLKLDRLIIYSLLKVYGANFEDDYNARYVQSLHYRKERILNEIVQLKKLVDEKENELKDVIQEINEAMGVNDEDDKIIQSDRETD